MTKEELKEKAKLTLKEKLGGYSWTKEHLEAMLEFGHFVCEEQKKVCAEAPIELFSDEKDSILNASNVCS